jgi:hypothetical protein
MKLLSPKENKKPMLKATLHRNVSRSTYGDISILFQDNSGKTHVLKFLRGLSIFTPNKLRIFDLPLDVPDGVNH